MKRVLVASDHAGLNLKNSIRDYLISLNYDAVDLGTS